MYFTCPKCKKTAEADIAMQGQLIECQHCGETVQVPYKVMPRKTPAAGIGAGRARGAEESGTALYFILGFLLSVIGILIAAIIAKEKGVKAALKGFLFNILLGFVFFLLQILVS